MTAEAPKDVRTLFDGYRASLDRLQAEADGTEAGRIIASRVAALSTWCDALELQMSQGIRVDMASYLKAVSTLRDLLAQAKTSAGIMQRIEQDAGPRDFARSVMFMHALAERAGAVDALPSQVRIMVAEARVAGAELAPTHQPTITRQ